MLDSTNEIAVALALLLALAASLEIGFRLGRRAVAQHDEPPGGQLGAVQGAVLGLLALLLGFSFSGAASRFIERQDLIVQEANAIGTAYLRADLLDAPHAARLRQALAQYVRHRLENSQRLGRRLPPETAAQVADFHARLWSAARDGALARPETLRVVLDPVNQVIDLHSTRAAAALKHLPNLVLALLIVCSLVATAVIGYGCGLSKRRSLPLTLSLILLIAGALWATIDLDHPRAGLIRLSDAPLEQLNLQPTP